MRVLSKDEFDERPFADISRVCQFIARPRDVAEMLVAPSWEHEGEDDGCGRVDRLYCLVTDDGEEFQVWAYKATSLYDPSLPSPESFWSSTLPFKFTVAGNDLSDEQYKTGGIDKVIVFLATEIDPFTMHGC